MPKVLEEELNKSAVIEYLPTQKGDIPITLANIKKAKKLLNYNPKISFKQGIKEYLRWLEKAS